MYHLVISAIVGLVWLSVRLVQVPGLLIAFIDSSLKKNFKAVVPRSRELLESPIAFLQGEDVRIGPGLRYAYSLFIGFPSGLILATLMHVLFLSDGHPLVAKPMPEQLLISLLFALTPILCSAIILLWSRGGELILRRDHVEFRYRNQCVVCPWTLFWVHGEPVILRYNILVLPVNPNEVDGIWLETDGVKLAVGRSVATHQFQFQSLSEPRVTNSLKLPEVVLRDLYAVNLFEIGLLLSALGLTIGPILDRERSSKS